MKQSYKGNVTRYGYTLNEFGGLNQLVRTNENEFSDMENMSSQQYPLLSVREKRQLLTKEAEGAEIVGLLCKEAVVKIIRHNGECRLYINENEISGIYLSADDKMCPKNIIGMGAYIVIFPDKRYVNLLDTTDKGELENNVELINSSGGFPTQITPCTADGEEYTLSSVGKTPPSNPKNGTVWVDTTGEKTVYKIWDSSTNQWQGVSSTYLKLSSPGIGAGFKKWDAAKFVSNNWSIIGEYGEQKPADNPIEKKTRDKIVKQLEFLKENTILYDVAEDNSFVIVAGIIEKACSVLIHKVRRSCPEMDFVIECNNRLWGCKYGLANGKAVNEIYACRQGDFKNWYAYLGVSTDSYAVSLGSDGPFTGAVTYGGYPIFFKQDVIHKIYGNIPANYQLLTTVCRGVEKGMEKSIVTVENTLFYKSPVDFCAYDGSLPVGISQRLKRCNFKKIVGGGLGSKIYWFVEESDGKRGVLVYDAENGIWVKESGENIKGFAPDGHILNYFAVDSSGRYVIKSVNQDYDTKMILNGEDYPKAEEAVKWYCESGDIGFSDIYQKYIKKLVLRARVHQKSEFKVYLSCDAGCFKKIGDTVSKEGIHSVSIPITSQRCDNFRYRLEGRGQVEIVSLYIEFDEGSDKA